MVTCGTIEVLPGFDANAVEIAVCGIDTDSVVAGQGTVNATVEVRNNNPNAAARATLSFTAGPASTTESITLQPNQTDDATASFVFESPGTYTVDVGIENVTEA